jgi:hypothetical protein
MEAWLDRNWYWLVGLALGGAYLAFSILRRDAGESVSTRIGTLNPFLDAKSWTPRAVLLAAVMIAVALVGIFLVPGGRR